MHSLGSLIDEYTNSEEVSEKSDWDDDEDDKKGVNLPIYSPIVEFSVNVILNKMPESLALTFLSRLLNHWINGDVGKIENEEIWASPTIQISTNLSLLFTLSTNEKEFRCWYAIPRLFNSKSVTSADDDGLLFSVEKSRKVTLRFAETLIPINLKRQVITLPNGVKVYGLYHTD